MKRFIFSFFLIFALSCSTSAEKNTRVKVQMFSGSQIECELLSVRDSSILIIPPGIHPDSLAYAESIPIEKIEYVHAGYIDRWEGPIIGGLFGMIAGTMIGASASIAATEGGISPPAFIGCVAGSAAGAVGGCYAGRLKTKYYPSEPDERESLRNFAVFPNKEPHELRKIK